MKVQRRQVAVPRAASATPPGRVDARPSQPSSTFGAKPLHEPVAKPEGQRPSSQVQLKASHEGTVFDGWLKVHDVSVSVTRGGITDVQRLKLLQRPGHDSTHVATLKLHGAGPPTVVYKDGDTRPAAALRGTPYVATGIVAGSLDHEGVDAEATALAEIAEEVGGRPLGRLVRVGAAMPTMPVTDTDGDVASSESDHYFVGVLADVQGEIAGDGGGLEVVGLIEPLELSLGAALEKIDSGGIRENARARVALQRALDKVGFLPGLGAWVSDLSPKLRERFDSLGLGERYDPRTTTAAAPPPEAGHAAAGEAPPMQNMHLAKQIDGVDLGAPKLVELGGGAQLIDSRVSHLADDGTGQRVPVGRPTPVQTLHTDHDRLKLAQYYVDPQRGPMVRLELVERPILAAKNALTGGDERAVRHDVGDLRVPLPKVTVKDGQVAGADGLDEVARQHALEVAQAAAPGAKVSVLSAPSYASPGQADLRYHFFAAEVPASQAGSGFVPLAEALKQMRGGGAGDANSEALLLRLADRLEWLPQLGMSLADARRALRQG